jgi:hypothetical protein
MLVGVTVDPREYANRIPVFPGSQMCRVFGYASKALPTWQAATGDRRIAQLRDMVPGIQPAAVFQDWPDDATTRARVNGWLDQVDFPVRLCWRHEADRKREDPTNYRRRWYALAQWVMDHPNGGHVTLTPTQTYQWTMSNAPGKGAGDWSTFYTGIGNPGVDVYADSWEAHYPDPAAFLAPLWRYRDTIGRNLEFPEFGAARVAGDTDGSGRADFLYNCAAAMRAEGVTAVCYWDDLGSNGTDLRLWTDQPTTVEVRAWSAVIAANAPAAEMPTTPVPSGETPTPTALPI